jgi:hypothetical protein
VLTVSAVPAGEIQPADYPALFMLVVSNQQAQWAALQDNVQRSLIMKGQKLLLQQAIVKSFNYDRTSRLFARSCSVPCSTPLSRRAISVGALAILTAKASTCTWVHSQKKVWKGLYKDGTTCCHHMHPVRFPTHANALPLSPPTGWKVLFVSTNFLADTLLMANGLGNDDEEAEDPEEVEGLRHATAVSAFMGGLITVSADGDCVRRSAPDDWDPTDHGPIRTQQGRAVSSNSFPSCNPMRSCVFVFVLVPCVCALVTQSHAFILISQLFEDLLWAGTRSRVTYYGATTDQASHINSEVARCCVEILRGAMSFSTGASIPHRFYRQVLPIRCRPSCSTSWLSFART